jgi:hypothetical protein
MQPEARLVKKLVDKLNELPNCYAEKNHGSPFGKPKLDITGALNGRMFQIEVKTPGNKPTQRQLSVIRKWQSVGVPAGCATCWEEVEDIIKQCKEAE